MPRKRLYANALSVQSIETLKSELVNYRDSIPSKAEQAVSELAKRGIATARSRATGEYGRGYIAFSMQVDPRSNGCTALVVATNTGVVRSEWMTKDGVKSVEVNALLMSEFGSGFKVQNPKGVKGVGQGTFPGQTHAFDQGGWSWKDLNGEWHHSTGVTPTMPMYNASLTIIDSIDEVIKEVFG